MPTTVFRFCLALLFCGCLAFPSSALAATYWVSPEGQAAWGACRSDSPLGGAAACSLATANSNAVAGDTIYLRGGTYTFTSRSGCGMPYTCGIYPKNRGVASARITYTAYKPEVPIITTDGTAPTYTTGITIAQGVAGAGTYIRVTGITFYKLPIWANLSRYASYNEIDHNIFYSDTGDDYAGAAGLSINGYCGGTTYGCNSTHNWIHHNVLSKVHQNGTEGCHEGADIIRIGSGYPTPDPAYNSSPNKDDYNTIEDNVLAYAGHTVLDTYGGYNVIRNNVMHNEGWIRDYSGGGCTYPPMPNGKYGHRGFQTSEDYGRLHQYILVEGNRLGFSSANPNNPGEANLAIASPSTIVRYNYSFAAHQSGIGTKWYRAFPDGLMTTLAADIDGTATSFKVASTAGLTTSTWNYIRIGDERISCTSRDATGFSGCTRGYLGTAKAPHNAGAAVEVNASANRGQAGAGPFNVRIYNNTSFWNGQTYPYMQSAQAGCTTCPGKLAGINVYSGALDVVVKNNIAFNNYSHTLYGSDVTVDSGRNPASYPASIIEQSNWQTRNGDPMFVNPDVSDPTSTVLPDLRLRPTSPAVDKGTSLTSTRGGASKSVTLVVDDAMYFQDGTWGSALARGVSFFPDWIAIGTVTNVVQVARIDYSTNTIILALPMSWNDRAPVWLYKKSDGAVVLVGNAPDMGAGEFGASPAAATNVIVR